MEYDQSMEAEILRDPISEDIEYSLSRADGTAIIRIETDNVDIKIGSKLFFKLIMIRHGETHKNSIKNMIKRRSENELTHILNSESDRSYDTDELIDDTESLPIVEKPLSHLDDKNSILNPVGESQARLIGSYLKCMNITKVVTSEITRAIQTGKIISNILDLSPEVDSDLHYDDKVVPNVAYRLINLIVKTAFDVSNGETVLHVTHNQTIDAIYRTCYGFDLKKTKYKNCSMTEIAIEFEQKDRTINLRICPIYFNKVITREQSTKSSAANYN
jgi:broad specificity phosphatase PhoE